MIIILCGESNSGKDTLLKHIIKDWSADNKKPKISPIISYTTRPMRPNETNGVNYFFVTEKEFLSKLEPGSKTIGKIFEYRKYDTTMNDKPVSWYYGAAVVDIANKNYATVLDPDGINAFLKTYGRENCYVIKVSAGDETRKLRAQSRGDFNETEWKNRLEKDTEQFSPKNTANIINAAIDNNDNNHSAFHRVDNLLCDLFELHNKTSL